MKIRWYIHEDIYDHSSDYVCDTLAETSGREPTLEEIQKLASALYEVEVEVDMETGKVTIPKEN